MDVIVSIAEFKHHMKIIDYSESTISSYAHHLEHFKRYLDEHNLVDMRKVTHQTILDYCDKIMSGNNWSRETKALKIRALKRLFEYLTNNHKLLINPTEGIVETTRKNRKIGRTLTIEEMAKLLDQPNLSLSTHIRDRAIMEVLYATGIRLDELLSLEVYHVDLKDKVVFVRKGKRGKQRVVPLSKPAIRFVKEYLENIRPHHVKKNPQERKLFLNHHGKPLAKGSIQSSIRNYGIMAGFKKPVSPHVFRRSCATHLLQQGADIRYIQKLLGHRHLSTTQGYTKVMPVDLKKTHEKTHPKGKKKNEN